MFALREKTLTGIWTKLCTSTYISTHFIPIQILLCAYKLLKGLHLTKSHNEKKNHKTKITIY